MKIKSLLLGSAAAHIDKCPHLATGDLEQCVAALNKLNTPLN